MISKSIRTFYGPVQSDFIRLTHSLLEMDFQKSDIRVFPDSPAHKWYIVYKESAIYPAHIDTKLVPELLPDRDCTDGSPRRSDGCDCLCSDCGVPAPGTKKERK